MTSCRSCGRPAASLERMMSSRRAASRSIPYTLKRTAPRARAPTRTNRTPCWARVVRSRSGSSGAGGAGSGTARGMDEAAEVTDFVEPALRWERQDAGDVVEHMRARAGPRIELAVDRESG